MGLVHWQASTSSPILRNLAARMVAHISVPLEILTALRPLETMNMRQGPVAQPVAVRTVLLLAPHVETPASHQERLIFTKSVVPSVRWSGCPAMDPAPLAPSSVARFALMILNKTSIATARESVRLGKSPALDNVERGCDPARMALFV